MTITGLLKTAKLSKLGIVSLKGSTAERTLKSFSIGRQMAEANLAFLATQKVRSRMRCD
jgi:hypothetical protein